MDPSRVGFHCKPKMNLDLPTRSRVDGSVAVDEAQLLTASMNELEVSEDEEEEDNRQGRREGDDWIWAVIGDVVRSLRCGCEEGKPEALMLM